MNHEENHIENHEDFSHRKSEIFIQKIKILKEKMKIFT